MGRVASALPRYGATRLTRHLLAATAPTAESATIAGRQRLLNLAQPTSDPSVAKLSLKDATELLTEGLSQLPQLAKNLATKPALELLDARSTDGASAFLVLDHDDLAGIDQRPHLPDRHGHFTAEPSPDTFAAATPLDQLLQPLPLDPLTVHDDSRFLTLLKHERNLPPALGNEIANLY